MPIFSTRGQIELSTSSALPQTLMDTHADLYLNIENPQSVSSVLCFIIITLSKNNSADNLENLTSRLQVFHLIQCGKQRTLCYFLLKTDQNTAVTEGSSQCVRYYNILCHDYFSFVL